MDSPNIDREAIPIYEAGATMLTDKTDADDRLSQARVLVELGELFDAEVEVAEILEDRADDLDALSLLAKIKHMRGELSQAMACWAQIHARSPLIEIAQVHLRAILHLAMNPERGAGEFIAAGQHQLVRKPVAHLELEQAFTLFLARHPEQAKARCAAVGARYKGKDPQIYRLAVLASAWIAELSGEIEEACRVLESLGTERGFETDTDRVLALARLYERLGTPQRLEAAAHICQYLESRYGTISLLGRMASLYGRLGKQELAREYERRYLEAFRRRKHRPTFAEVTEVACRRYLPLARLRNIRFPATELPADPAPRRQAIAKALRDDTSGARAQFLTSGAVLDRKYIADLAAIEGDDEGAIAAYVAVLNEEPGDIRVISWLLAYHARKESSRIADFFHKPATFALTHEALDAAIRATPLRPSLWRHFATLLAMDRAHKEEGRRAAERASALEQGAQMEQNPIGRALAAAAFHFVGKTKGIIHEVWAGRDVAEEGRGGALPASQILGNITPDMRQAVQNTFLSVREYARSKFPHLTGDILDYNYTHKITKEDEPSSGLSAGLPTALAFLSVMLQKPIPQDVASTGTVVADAHDVLVVGAVGDVEHKIKAAYHRNMRMIVLPLGNRNQLLTSSQVPSAIREDIVRYAANLDEAVRLVFGEDAFISSGRPAKTRPKGRSEAAA